MSLFDSAPIHEDLASDAKRPLAERMRPDSLDGYIGQEHILGPGKPLRAQIERDELTSLILWGPPGVGKTTLARLIARTSKCDFIPFSAVMAGIKEIKAVMTDAEKARRMGRRTVVFIDEIHRFNKAQQDAFLPYVERGDIILIGATTENPSFEVNSALLSRAKVFALRSLTTDEVVSLLERALTMLQLAAPRDLLEQIAIYSNGDARAAYNILELASAVAREGVLDRDAVESVIERKLVLVRQGRRAAFQLDFRSAQEHSIVGCGCRAVLAREDVGGRRGSAVYRAAIGEDGDRRYRTGGSARAGAGDRGAAGGAFSGESGRRSGAGTGGDLSGGGAEVGRVVSCAGASDGGGAEIAE